MTDYPEPNPPMEGSESVPAALSILPQKLRGHDGEQELHELGIACSQEVDHSETGKGSLPERWEQNEALYNLDPSGSNLNEVDGVVNYMYPLTQPKIDRIIGVVMKAITSIDPYVQCLPKEDENKEAVGRVERAVHTVATSQEGKYGFDRAFRQGVKIAANCGIGILYVRLVGGCVQYEPVHPKEFVAYPHEMADMAKMQTIGHRFFRTLTEIKDLQEAGEYLKVDLAGSDDMQDRGGRSTEFSLVTDTPARIPDDEKIELYQLVRKCDLGEGRKDYLIVLAKRSMKVLRVEKLEYTTSRLYFDIRFDDEYGSFWPAASPANSLQQLQLIVSDIINVLIHGNFSTAYPPMAIIGATLKQKMARYGAGTVWELPAGASMQVAPLKFEGNGLAGLLPMMEKGADGVSGISQLGMSQNLPSGTTATAAQGVLQAQDEAKGAYSTFVAPVVAQIYCFVREMMQMHWGEIKAYQESDLGIEEYSDLLAPMTFQPTGKSTNSSPAALLQKIQLLLAMAKEQGTTLDYQALEKQVVQAIDLPFDPASVEKGLPSSEELLAVLAGLLSGQVSPQEAAQILQEANNSIGQGTPGAGQQGQSAPQLPGGIPPASSGPAS